MADFDLSMAVDADATPLVKAADDSTAAVDRLGKAGETASAGMDAVSESASAAVSAVVNLTGVEQRLEAILGAIQQGTIGAARGHAALRDAMLSQSTAAAGLVTSTNEVASAQAGAATSANAEAVAEQRLAEATSDAEKAQAAAALAALKLKQAQDSVASSSTRAGHAHKESGASLGSLSIAAAESGHAVRAFVDSVNAGQSPVRAFTLELPRLTQAAGFAGGALGAVGEFLSGPWGIALTLAITAGAGLISSLLDTETAAEKADKSIEIITADIKGLGAAIDQQTGKLDAFNASLAKSQRLQLAGQTTSLRTALGEQSRGIIEEGEAFSSKSARGAIGGALTLGLGANVALNADNYRDVNQALAEANGNAEKFVASITRLTATNPGLRDFQAKISGLNVERAKSAASLQEASAAELKFDTVAQGGAVQTKETIENEIARRTATDASAKATQSLTEARQRLTKAEQDYDRTGPTKGATDALNAAKDGVVSAQKALDAINSAPKAKRPKHIADPTAGINALTNEAQADIDTYGTAPTFLSKANQELTKLQEGLDKLDKIKPRSPLDTEAIAKAKTLLQTAADTIRDNIDKPYADYVRQQTESLAVLRLQVAGRNDDADALKQVYSLQRQMGPLTDQQKDGVLATVQAMRAEQRELDILKEKNANYSSALGSIKSAFEGVFTDGAKGLKDLPKQLLSAFTTLKGKVLFDNLLGGVFRDLQDQIDGTKVVEDASARMADAVDAVSSTIKTADTASSNLAKTSTDTTSAIKALGDAASGAASSVSGRAAAGAAEIPNSGSSGGLAKVLDANGNVIGSFAAPAAPDLSTASDNSGAIVVNGQRSNSITRDPTSFFSKALGGIAGKAIGSIASTDTLTKLASKLGIGNKSPGTANVLGANGQVVGSFAAPGAPVTAQALGQTIGKFAGNAISGAATGAVVNSVFAPIAKAIGVKTSKTGAEVGVGGASAIAGLFGRSLTPLGSAVVGVLGSVIGGLFKTTKYGTSVVTDTGVTAGKSNSGSLAASSATEGNSVSSAVSSIISQLGGTAGSYNVSIGTYGTGKDKYRVSGTGASGKLGGSASYRAANQIMGYASEEEAEAAAVADAIKDGAVKGISAAMQRALQANASDADKAVSEALKVKSIETAIGGIGASLKATFDTFDASAKDSLDTAKKYGIDVAAVEKANATARTKLVADTLKSSVGSLQDLLTSITSGDLFEGSASDKRSAILSQIADTKTKADAGEEGAADSLSQLYQSLLSNSKSAFGTAGTEYASDRATATSGANEVIKAATDRINAAAGLQQATTTAVEGTTAAVNEVAALQAETNAGIGGLAQAIAAAAAVGALRVGGGTIRKAALN